MRRPRMPSPSVPEIVVLRLLAPLALLAALPGLAAAQKPDPAVDARAAEAKTACAAGEVQKGIRLLAELYTATDNPTWLFNQGRCYQQNGQPAQALTRFKEYLRKGANEPEEDLRTARQHISELETELAAQATPAPAPLGTGAPVEPGRTGRFNRLQITGLALGGFGVVSLATGAFFSYKVQAAENEVNDLTRGQTVVEAGTVKDNDRSGARYEILQWVSYGVGLAAVAAGATTFFIGAGRGAERSGVALTVSPVVGPGVVGSFVGGTF
jgi:VCBS repeat-containing protein